MTSIGRFSWMECYLYNVLGERKNGTASENNEYLLLRKFKSTPHWRSWEQGKLNATKEEEKGEKCETSGQRWGRYQRRQSIAAADTASISASARTQCHRGLYPLLSMHSRNRNKMLAWRTSHLSPSSNQQIYHRIWKGIVQSPTQ